MNSSSTAAPIWAPADLVRLLEHDLGTVRAWALAHLTTQDRDRAAPHLVQLLDDPEPLPRSVALRLLDGPPVPAAAEALRRIEQGKARDERSLARQALMGWGDESAKAQLLRDLNKQPALAQEWPDLQDPDLRARVQELVLHRRRVDFELLRLWTQIAPLEHAADIVGRLSGNYEVDVLAELLLRRIGGVPRVVLETSETIAGSFEDALEAFGEVGLGDADALTSHAEDLLQQDVLDALEGNDWPGVLAPVLERLEATLPAETAYADVAWYRAVAAAIAAQETPTFIHVSVAFGLLLGAHRAAVVERLDRDGLEASVAVQVWGWLDGPARAAFQPDVVKAWERADEADRDNALEMLAALLDEDPWVDVEGAFALTQSLDPEAFDGFVDRALGTEDAEVALAQLEAHPEALQRLAPRLLAEEDGPVLTNALQLLQIQDGRWAADLVLHHLERLRQTEGGFDAVWAALRELGDVRALGRAREEWRPGEPLIAEAADFLATLVGTREELEPELRKEAEWLRGRLVELDHDAPQTVIYPLRHLPLACTACARIGFYPMGQVFIREEEDPHDPEEVRIALRAPTFKFRCKWCQEAKGFSYTETCQEVILDTIESIGGAGGLTPDYWIQLDDAGEDPETGDFGLAATEEPIVRDQPKIGRNDPCPCGSGKKYKKCCLRN